MEADHQSGDMGVILREAITVAQEPMVEMLPTENVKVAVTVISGSDNTTMAEKAPQMFEAVTDPFKCKYCQRVFKNNGALHSHMKRYEDRTRQELRFDCKTCGRQFKNKGGLVTHGKTHTKDKTTYAKAIRLSDAPYAKAVKVVGGDDGDRKVRDQMNKGNENEVEDNVSEDENMRKEGGDGRSMRHRGKYSCPTCSKTFESRGGLLIHQQSHAGVKKSFQCQSCDKSYLNEGALVRHAKIHDLLNPNPSDSDSSNLMLSHRCVLCNQRFKVKGYLGKHIKRCHPEHSTKNNDYLLRIQRAAQTKAGGSSCTLNTFKLCKLCGKHFQHRSNLLRHVKTHKNTYQCPLCQTSMTPEDTLEHDKSCQPISKGEKQQNGATKSIGYKCHLCGKEFKLEHSFSRHVALHRINTSTTTTKTHVCQVCNKIFSKSYLLKYHMTNTHKDGAVFKCASCPTSKLFQSKSALQLHAETHVSKPYKCEICGWAMRHKHTYQKHRLVHKQRCFKCNTCQKPFVKQLDMTNHIKSEHEQKQASDGLQLQTTGDEQKHQDHNDIANTDIIHQEQAESTTINNTKPTNLRLVDTSSKLSTECKLCNKVFSTRKDWRNHMRVHRKVSYKCDFCDKIFNRLYTLRAHLKIIHKKVLCNTKTGLEGELVKLHFSNQVLFKCPVCGFVFIHRKELAGHLKIHTGQKPYTCSTCETGFNGRFQLQEHVSNTHPEVVRSKRSRHVCSVCSKAFMKSYDFKRHLKVHYKHGHISP